MPFQTYKYKRDRVVCNMIFILINICTWKEIKKSPNHKITKSRNQEILDTQLQKGQSRMQYDLHIDQHFHLKRNQEIKIHSILYPLIHSSFPITFRPIWNFHHWWSNRERRTLNMARSTASLPLLVDFHTAFIIPFPSIMSRISPSEYNLNNHSSVDFMTFAESESRANRRGYKMNSTLKFDNPNTNEFEFRFEESERVSILSSTDLHSQPNNTHSSVMHA